MYCSHFGLQRQAFNNTPDPTFYYSTPDHEEALATLQYAAQQRKGFVLVSGEIGAGKTLIGRIFLRQMDANATVAVIHQTNLSGRQLLAAICSEFQLPVTPEASALELTAKLQDFLLQEFARDRIVVVLLDEAQNLPDESFEELRMLGNLEADDAKLLQVCILGQPELRDRFSRPNMRQLEQRLFRRFHLPALSARQTAEYVLHRLAVAGAGERQLFTPGALTRIHQASGGIPRLINQICDNALLTAYGRGAQLVDEQLLELVLDRDSSLRAEPAAVGDGDATAHLEAERLAELALGESRQLGERLGGLAETGGQQHAELSDIAQRQNELQKIVSGATTRWLAAKEKLEAYRNQIQSVLDDLAARCARTEQHLTELARSSAPVEKIEEVRRTQLHETQRLMEAVQLQGTRLDGHLAEAEARWERMRAQVEGLSGQALAEWSRKYDHRIEECVASFEQQRRESGAAVAELIAQADKLRSEVDALAATTASLSRDSEAAVQRINGQLADQERQLRGLKSELAAGLESIERELASIGSHTVQPRDLDCIRAENSLALSEMMRRYNEQSAAFRKLKEVVAREIGTGARQRQLAELTGRLDRSAAELNALGEKMTAARAELESRLAQMEAELAARSARQLDELRAQQREEIGRVVAQLQAGERTVGEHCESLRARCEEIERQLEAVRQEAAGSEAVEKLSSRHAEDIAAIRAALSGQQREFEGLAGSVQRRCEEAINRLNALPNPLPTAGEVQAIRLECAQQVQLLHQELAERKQRFDFAVQQLTDRCDQLHGELLALRAETASAQDVEAVRQDVQTLRDQQVQHVRALRDQQMQETAALRQQQELSASALREEQQQRVDELLGRMEAEKEQYLEQLAGLDRRWEALSESLQKLAANSASPAEVKAVEESLSGAIGGVEQRVEAVRQEHEQRLAGLLETLDAARGQHQQDVEELHRRWAALAENVRNLSANSTAPASLQAVEETLQEGLGELRERVARLGSEQEQNLRAVAAKVVETSQRLLELEASRREPIKVELRPEVYRRLRDTVDAAQEQREGLSAALERAGAVTAHLHNSSNQIQEVMGNWTAAAAEVRAESERLRSSAKLAAGVLDSMQRCHARIEATLNAQSWRTQLQQAESLAGRLEAATAAARTACGQLQAVLHDFQGSREEMLGWEQRRQQACQLAERLAGLLAEANTTAGRFDRTLAGRKRLLEAIARNSSSLAEIIKSARLADESDPAAAEPGRQPLSPAEPGRQQLSPATEPGRKPLSPAAQRLFKQVTAARAAKQATPVQWRTLKTHAAS